jgi:aldose sugar dehydrogenase
MLTVALPLVALLAAHAAPPTPTAASPKATGWKAVTAVEGLEHPWAVAWLPDTTMLITERDGRLRVVRDGKLDPTPVSGVPDVLALRQGGLLDVAIHPNFAENQWIYLSYSTGTNGSNNTRIARGKFDGKALTDIQVLFDAEPKRSNGFHFGSRMIFLPDGTLLFSVGDGGNNQIRVRAQDVGAHLGKLLRIKDDGSVAKDNPFHSRVDAKPEVWSYGHRNIQGLARDPVSGRIWATEHGPLGGDELNLVEPGKNYGWPTVTFGREYSGAEITKERQRDEMVDAKVVWTPCIAPSGLVVYTGDRFPEWKGDVFAGGLILQQIRRIDLDADGNVVGQQTLQFDDRIRDVRQGPDGYLYALTDEAKGRLIRIEPDSAR